jgi:diguanylate cyclase (GGDEF)-like protein
MKNGITLGGYIDSIKGENIPEEAKKRLIGGAYKLFGIDQKTGIHNYTFLVGRLGEMIDGSQRPPASELSIALYDLDKFGRYSKNPYSVPLGDRVIKAFARTCGDGMRRKIDFAARYGGDENVTVHLKTSKQAAAEIAENIRRNLSSLIFDYHNTAENINEQVGVTASCGVGSVDDVEQIKILHSVDGNQLLLGFLRDKYAELIKDFGKRTGIKDEKVDFYLSELREMARHYLEENDLSLVLTPREALVHPAHSKKLRNYMAVESFIGEVDRRGLQKAKSEGGNRVVILDQ